VRDIEFYAQVLGLEDPWFVQDVDLSIETKRIDISVVHHEGRLWPCRVESAWVSRRPVGLVPQAADG
jgi:transposase